MEYFAGYGFNKSHSAAYAMIAYWTAYFKANYPQAFMAALLTSVIDRSDKVGIYIEECRKLGIPIYPPDVNHSQARFTVEDRGIRIGLLAVKNLGEGAIEEIVLERRKEPFKSLYDFCRRLDLGLLNKRAVESLIKVGAFASTKRTRREMLEALENAFEQSHRLSALRRDGQLSFFDLDQGFTADTGEHWTGAEEFPQSVLLNMEKEYLGVYLTGHPIDPWKDKFKKFGFLSIAETLEEPRDGEIIIGGVVSNWRRLTTKAGKSMATFALEDLTASIEVLVFPKLYEKTYLEADNDRVVVVKGRVDVNEKEKKLLASQIRWLSDEQEE